MNPLLLDIPHELGSERLRFRSPGAGDGAIVFPTARASLEELKQWMPWATDDYSLEFAEEWCRKAAAAFLQRINLNYLILAREDGRHLGNIGTFQINWSVPRCEIGYWLASAETGRGFMTEAVVTVSKMMQETVKMRRIELRADETNRRSRAVAERAGFTLEGIHRNQDRHPVRGVQNMCMYARVFNPAD